jgi:hypothetical protein
MTLVSPLTQHSHLGSNVLGAILIGTVAFY